MGAALALLLTLAPAGAGGEGTGADDRATGLRFDGPTHGARLVVLESMPPQFALVIPRTMPTPGWSTKVDQVRIEREHGRIVAKVTEREPDGIVAQVLTKAELHVTLGYVPVGKHGFELYVRRGRGEYKKVETWKLTAWKDE